MTCAPAPVMLSGEHFDLRIDYSRREIALRGEFDIACTPHLATAVIKLQHLASGTITLRFDDVEFIDMAGLGSIVGARSAQLDRGDELSISGASVQIQRMFELASLAGLLNDDHNPPRAAAANPADLPPRARD